MNHIKALLVSITFFTLLSPPGPLWAADDSESLGKVTVTGTREEEKISETPAAVGVVEEEEIERVKPVHPSEIARRVPGVHVNVTSGEGHMTAIRQPLTTGPVYLYLEDGIPTRSTGFFNHNALYEVNVPQAQRLEITKGPGTSLYGSDAIGGVVNVLTRPAPLEPTLEIIGEAGSYGWYRALVSAGDTWGEDGLRGDVNITHTDGWRDATSYDRQSFNARWDRYLGGGASLKVLLSGSNIDQTTAGSSALSRADYENDPKLNYTPISFRDVKALRGSVTYERESGSSLVSVIPYFRYNYMEILPNWSLTYDPQRWTTENKSVGVMTKYRRDFQPMSARVLAGVDLDYSPGTYYEQTINPTRVGSIFTSYTVGDVIYDYDVSFLGVSPYVHGEVSPTEKLKVQAGLRYDHMEYSYDNQLTELTTGSHRRPADTDASFDHLSPKVGLTYQAAPGASLYANYRHAFRVPSERQLFRQGRAVSTVDLDPVKADSFEAGVKGRALERVDYEVSAYYMTVEDDVLSFTNTVTGTRETTNAGETLHKGVEVGLAVDLARELVLDGSYSYSEHTFERWSPKTGVDFSGNEMTAAPNHIGSARLTYTPAILGGGFVQVEYEYLGGYWEDDENTSKYEGHDLVNLRGSYRRGSWELFAKVLNLFDERYATRAKFTQFRGEELAPGMPLTLYGGLTLRFM